MQEIKVCAYCGAMTGVFRLFCPECGKRLPKDTVYMQYRKRHRCCRFCGKVLSKDMQFCPDCGQKLE